MQLPFCQIGKCFAWKNSFTYWLHTGSHMQAVKSCHYSWQFLSRAELLSLKMAGAVVSAGCSGLRFPLPSVSANYDFMEFLKEPWMEETKAVRSFVLRLGSPRQWVDQSSHRASVGSGGEKSHSCLSIKGTSFACRERPTVCAHWRD